MRICVRAFAAAIPLLSLFAVQSCAIDTPLYNSTTGTSCRSAFDLDKSSYSYFDYSGSLNGVSLISTAAAISAVPVNAPATRQIILNTEKFSLTINLTASSYGTKTIATGNPEIWMSAVTCADYLICSTEKYVAGVYNGTLRGSGTVTLSRPSAGSTRIVVNATLPDENTSVSQTLQFQNVTFNEVCY